MKTLLTFVLVSICCFGAAGQDNTVFPRGELAPNLHHTGDVWLYHVSAADPDFDYNVAVATFAAGARLDWHIHPAGQQLLIIEGTGYYQERGKEVQIVNKGDAIKCQPGVEHWHAASADNGVTYLAISGNKRTNWLEPVSEEVYKAIKGD
ncbi:cupin domain-containing protein [Flagellimonas algicola]|uniref:Cupin domain-containing protein n=1 Tax=Flagellimonas algicola TaxID=2583815 RepID=A0ABY2WRH7_9FLAO|nr:cupin domain-containing protein [Allomuricauda algicola]TMU57114.1 cupin domain-containing protein [Allomuricauda algicola]